MTASQPSPSRLSEPSNTLPVYRLRKRHVQPDHPMRQELSQTCAAHRRYLHTRVTPLPASKMVHAPSQVANNVPNPPKKMVHSAAQKRTRVPDTNLDFGPVLASQTQPEIPNDTVSSRFTTSTSNTKAYPASLPVQNPPKSDSYLPTNQRRTVHLANLEATLILSIDFGVSALRIRRRFTRRRSSTASPPTAEFSKPVQNLSDRN